MHGCSIAMCASNSRRQIWITAHPWKGASSLRRIGSRSPWENTVPKNSTFALTSICSSFYRSDDVVIEREKSDSPEIFHTSILFVRRAESRADAFSIERRRVCVPRRPSFATRRKSRVRSVIRWLLPNPTTKRGAVLMIAWPGSKLVRQLATQPWVAT